MDNANIPPQQGGIPPLSGTLNQGQGQINQVGSWAGPQFSNFVQQAYPVGQQMINNPYAPQAQAGAATAGQMGQQAAQNQFGAGGAFTNFGVSGVLPYAQSIFQTGFDPQQDLYNRTLQQVQDQQRVANAAAGVGTSPYGAALEGQQTRNFNIDWQNQQLARQAQALGAGAGAGQTAAGTAGAGAGMQAGAAPLFMQSAAMPYQTSVGQAQTGLGGIGTVEQLMQGGQNLSQVPFQDLMSMLSGQISGDQLNNQIAALNMQQQQNQFNNLARIGQGLGSGLGMVPWSNVFNSMLPSNTGYYGTGNSGTGGWTSM